MNTIDNEKSYSRKNINQKVSFPNLFNNTYKSSIISANSHKNLFFNSNNNNSRILAPIKNKNNFHINRKKISELNFIHMLNLDNKVTNIINTDLNLKKQKLKIDNNITIKNFRLGVHKKKEEENNKENNENEKDNNNNIIKKEKDNEDNVEKLETNLKDKEKILEKKFGIKLDNLNKAKNEIKNISDKLDEINKEIENDKIEEKILVDYANEFDTNYEKNLDLVNEDNEYMNDNMYLNQQQNNINKSSNHLYEMNKKMNKEFEKKNKLILFRQKREKKKKLLRENILDKEELKLKLQSELTKKKSELTKVKEDFLSVRDNLINRYHIKLYEGISFHNEGLPSIIKEIWKLNAEVDINFMPSYLDPQSIQYLFQRARQSMVINHIRQEIKEAENDFIFNLKEWRNDDDDDEFDINENKRNNNKFFNLRDKNKNKNSTFDENELFKTKISDISVSYLEPYPKTKQFIIDYRRNHPQKFRKEMPKLKYKNLKFKSYDIPPRIIEKNKKIEKLKFILEITLKQNELNDKREVERLNKEFTLNNYGEKYKVNVETLFGAIFGDKKNEMLIYYSRLEKDLRDNNKLIQFHTKYNSMKYK